MPELSESISSSAVMPSYRSAQKIKEDIEAEKELISETLDRIGAKVREKMNWRFYIGQYPVASLGVAAGVGFLLSGAFTCGSAAKRSANASNDRSRQTMQSSLKMALLSLATKAVTSWITDSLVASRTRGSGMGQERIERSRPEIQPRYHS